MKIYLVGGAVRDHLLGLPVKEKDWVVVGATIDDMLKQKFRQVGKDFPVFIHPKTGEEYALARTERKTGPGYTGFAFNASPQVSLEDDLKRRDLTINAMAETPDGTLIDPYHGKKDLEKKLLRHVSDAFIEDPVRILRVARFAARFAEFGFTIAPETLALMKKMVASGEVDALVAERVWKELERALAEKHPEQFFVVLQECGAFAKLFPPLTIDTLKKAAANTTDTQIRFAVLLHKLSLAEIDKICERYRVPSDYRDLAKLVSKFCAVGIELNPECIVDFLQAADAFRRETRFEKLLQALKICTSLPIEIYRLCFDEVKKINVKEVIADLPPKDIAEAIKKERIKKITECLAKLG